MTPKTKTLVLKQDRTYEHNMIALEFVPEGRYFLICAGCASERELTREDFEGFLERVPGSRSINLMGVLRYEG